MARKKPNHNWVPHFEGYIVKDGLHLIAHAVQTSLKDNPTAITYNIGPCADLNSLHIEIHEVLLRMGCCLPFQTKFNGNEFTTYTIEWI